MHDVANISHTSSPHSVRHACSYLTPRLANEGACRKCLLGWRTFSSSKCDYPKKFQERTEDVVPSKTLEALFSRSSLHFSSIYSRHTRKQGLSAVPWIAPAPSSISAARGFRSPQSQIAAAQVPCYKSGISIFPFGLDRHSFLDFVTFRTPLPPSWATMGILIHEKASWRIIRR
jgi:hypothetical protein